MSTEEISSVAGIDDSLPVSSKLAYGFANAANGALSGVVFAAITFFYNIKLGLGEEYIGWAWLIFAGWNAINDPLIGVIEEHTKTDIGRRIPYIRYGAPVYGVLFILCWYPFLGNTQMGLFLNLIMVLFVFDTVYSMIGLITYSLPAEMCFTAEGRANLAIYSTLIGSIGLITSNLVPMLLLTGDNSTTLNPWFKPVMVIMGVVFSSMMFISSYYLKENDYTQMEEALGLVDSVKVCFKNKPFLIFEVSMFSFILAQTILTTGIFYYVTYVLHLTGAMVLVPIVSVFGMVFMLTFYFGKMVEKRGLKKTYVFGLTWAGLTFFLLFFMAFNLLSAILGLLLVGVGFSAIIVTSQPVMADVIDFDETLTGKRRETTYSGVNALITKPAISIANWAFLYIIAAYGFDKMKDIQSHDAQVGIVLGITVVPAIFILISALVMRRFPLDGPEWDKEKLKLAEIHIQKELDYVEYVKQQSAGKSGKPSTDKHD